MLGRGHAARPPVIFAKFKNAVTHRQFATRQTFNAFIFQHPALDLELAACGRKICPDVGVGEVELIWQPFQVGDLVRINHHVKGLQHF